VWGEGGENIGENTREGRERVSAEQTENKKIITSVEEALYFMHSFC